MSETYPVPACLPAPVNGRPDLLFIVGEHSGDEHAAELVTDLLQKQPDLKIACLGGPNLEAAGAQLLFEMTAVSIVGFVEVARQYGFFKRLFNRTLDWIEEYRPKHICFVDYPGFNLRLADQLAQRGLSVKGGGSIGLSYYIGPQVWAWKAGRRFKMERVLDRLGVIFPFEVECFQDTSLPVEFVGHPFAEVGHRLPFVYDPEGPVLLLPGSRSAAVGRIFPVLLEGFARARTERPELKALVVYPSQQIKDLLEAVLERYPDLQDSVILSGNGTVGQPARAVLMSSGTMSLAVALSSIPGAIAYRLNPLSYWIGRMVVKIPYIGIANILLNRPLHKEYIQNEASAETLSAELLEACTSEAGKTAAHDAEAIRSLLHPSSQASAADWLLKGMDESALGKALAD
ncbi:MAG: lipid-A-disaccharide synthase [Coraliomargaritaceae bacterium]